MQDLRRQILQAKILIVDDEAANVKLLEKILAREGYINVWSTTNPQEVRKIHREKKFDLILLDLKMPGFNGFAVMEQLVEDIENDYLPVLVLTALSDGETRLRALTQGAKDFITKPFEQKEILSRIQNILEVRVLYNEKKELLEKTLSGSVRMLVNTLSLSDPQTFDKAVEIRDLVRKLALPLKLPEPWEIELAAMLSRIGEVTIPAEVNVRNRSGDKLTSAEKEMIEHIPEFSRNMIFNIPRLQNVAKIVYYQNKCFDGNGFPDDVIFGNEIPLASRFLKILNDALDERLKGKSRVEAFNQLSRRKGHYDRTLLNAVRAAFTSLDLWGDEAGELPVSEVSLEELTPGCLVVSNIVNRDGELIFPAGAKLTSAHIAKLRNIAKLTSSIKEPIEVCVTNS